MDLKDKLLGLKDARGPRGIMSRGSNIYPGGSKAAQKGHYSNMAKKLLKRGYGSNHK